MVLLEVIVFEVERPKPHLPAERPFVTDLPLVSEVFQEDYEEPVTLVEAVPRPHLIWLGLQHAF